MNKFILHFQIYRVNERERFAVDMHTLILPCLYILVEREYIKMGNNNLVMLEGYEFECINFVCREGTTAITVRVSGDGSAANDLPGWILEICPAGDEKEINIISCEKRRDNGAWMPAIAQKTTTELMGDIGVSGVFFEERVGKAEKDPAVEFRITFDKLLTPVPLGVAFVSGAAVFKSIEKMQVKLDEHTLITKLWSTPIEKTFCLYLVIPGGYKPQGACKTNVSIIKRGAFLYREAKSEADDEKLTPAERSAVSEKTSIKGYVKIIASVPLKSYQACGDDAYANGCDCFEINDAIGYTNVKDTFELRDISVCPNKKSLDLTLLNSHCGKSVYRLDGKYIIDCKRCK